MSETNSKRNRIIFVGLGRGGIRAFDLLEKHKDADYLICDTDNFHLNKSSIENKLMLNVTSDFNSPDNFIEFENQMKNGLMVFFVCSLGGKIGSEILPKLLLICNKLSIYTVCILTKPFLFEGFIKTEIANKSKKANQELATSTIVIENEICQNIFPDFKMSNAYHYSQQLLAQHCDSFANILFSYGILSLDFADLRNVIKNREKTVVCYGSSTNPNRLYNAFQSACNHPFIKQYSINQFEEIILYYYGSENHMITMEEIGQDIFPILDTYPETSFRWNFILNDEMTENVTLIMIASKSNKAVEHLQS